jgi:hypothetical protein
MASPFARNINGRGRLVRGISGGLLLLAGGLVFGPEPWRLWTCLGLLASGAFVIFEAVRGWCIMRACGVRTRM